MASLTRTFAVALSAVMLTLGISVGNGDGISASKHRETAYVKKVRVGTEGEEAARLGDLTAWLAGVERAENERLFIEAANQAAAAAAATRSTAYHPGTTVGECTGFAIPDYIISRESGGNPSAYNPSGAYGCAQTLLSHYSSGSCQGLDPYTIEGQRECVWILSSGGTNLNPWAATR